MRLILKKIKTVYKTQKFALIHVYKNGKICGKQILYISTRGFVIRIQRFRFVIREKHEISTSHSTL